MRYVGEPVAIVVADTLAEAMDAAERVDVVYDPLTAVARSRDALAPEAPLVWEQHGSNRCIDSETGDKEATDAAFAGAAHIVRLETTINRVTGVPMELRAALGVYDESAAQFAVHTAAAGGVVRHRDDIAGTLGVKKDSVGVISGDVGGNFGIRNNTCPEFELVAWAAKRAKRPVKWICERSIDRFSRPHRFGGRTCPGQDGNFLALRAVNTSGLGANNFLCAAGQRIAVSSSVYHIRAPIVRCQCHHKRLAHLGPAPDAPKSCSFSNMIDIACRRHGFDRLELRRPTVLRR